MSDLQKTIFFTLPIITASLGILLGMQINEQENQIRYGDYVVVKEGFHQGRRGQVSEISRYNSNLWKVNFSSGEDANAEFESRNLMVLERKVEIEPWSKD